MARPSRHRVVWPVLMLAAGVVGGCGSGGPTSTASSAGGLSSGDAVGRSLFTPEARSIARGERPPNGRAMASVVIQPE